MRKKFDKEKLLIIGILPLMWFAYFLFELFTGRIDTEKSINLSGQEPENQYDDTYGHGYGDDVLREAGRLMLEEMLEKGIAARFGGEEFMLVFEQDDREQVLHSFRNIQEGLRRYSQNTRQTDITISGGMERYEADKQLDLLLTSVDRKLYSAKNNGKNRIVE